MAGRQKRLVLAVWVLAIALVVGGAALAAPLEAPLVIACAPQLGGAPAASLAELEGALTALATEAGQVGLRVTFAACPERPPEGADVVVAAASLAGGDHLRITVSLRLPHNSVAIAVAGRWFRARLVTQDLELDPLPVIPPTGGDRSLLREVAWNDARVILAVMDFVAARKQDEAGGKTDAAAAARARERTTELWRRIEDDRFAASPAETQATLKQLRALSAGNGLCGEETPTDLVRQAARLVPHSSDARMLAAVIRLRESYEPPSCTVAAERTLLKSVALDPWNADAVKNLSVLYELSANAPPGAGRDHDEISVEQATQVLGGVWGGQAPRPPRSLEIAVGAALAKSDDGDLMRSLAPQARVDVTFGRDGPGWGARAGFSLPWSRDLQLQGGAATWTRMTFSLGARYRFRLRRFYGEIGGDLAAGPVHARGNGFDENYSSTGFDAGCDLTARVGKRLGRMAVWLGVGASDFFASKISGWPSVQVQVRDLESKNFNQHQTIPSWDFFAGVGVSTFFWL